MKANETLQASTQNNDVTEKIDNQSFMEVIFGSSKENERPIVVSFEGNPSDVSGGAWWGKAWRKEAAHNVAENANNYFSQSTFLPESDGGYRRKKANFVELRVIVLDDVGTKVPMERLRVAPSWLLETSEGNFQAGYILEPPIADGGLADRLMKAVIKAELCDPGAGGPLARLSRLPVGVNGKSQQPFKCQLKEWHPDTLYSAEDLISGFKLDMNASAKRGSSTVSIGTSNTDLGDMVWIPKPADNPVLVALQDRNLYKSPMGNGKHDITCPWVDEHTDAVDGGTAYFEPDDSWPVGGFKCLHGHCADRHLGDLLAYLSVEPNSARMKSTIRVVAGEIHTIVDAAERELARTGRYYQRGSLIVTVVSDPATRETQVTEVSQPALVRALAGAANWERFDNRMMTWKRIDPPARHAAVLFDSSDYAHLPILNGLVRQPYLRPDGSLMTSPGYDPVTGMFGVFVAEEFDVPIKPTENEAKEALGLLADLLTEFSFASDADRAAALSAMLTATARSSLSLAPMFHARAHMQGSGKSYLDELITAFATPQRCTPTTFPADDEECRKLLLADLIRAPAVIEFDNLTTDLLAHKSLCTALTSESMSGRVLGVTKMATVSTRALFLSSGNNVGPVNDMTRRCITINLSPQCETPAARVFKRPDLVRDVRRERGKYVSAALTVIRAWIVAGRPKTKCRSLVSYGDWSDLCRQPLLWLGCADPTDSVFCAMAEDPERETIGRMLQSWWGRFGNQPKMIREVLQEIQSFGHPELRGDENLILLGEVIRDIADERGEINRRRLGRWIKRQSGRIVDGLRFVRASGNTSSERWFVESVSTVSSEIRRSEWGNADSTVSDSERKVA